MIPSQETVINCSHRNCIEESLETEMPNWQHKFVLGKGRQESLLGNPCLHCSGLFRKAMYLCMTCVTLKVFFQILKYISRWWLAGSVFPRLQGTEFLLHTTPSRSMCLARLCTQSSASHAHPRSQALIVPFQRFYYSCWQRLDICSPRANCRAILQLQCSLLFYFFNQEKGWTCNVNLV